MLNYSMKFILGFFAFAMTFEAHAQSMEVNKGRFLTYADQVTVKVEPRNPTQQVMHTQVRVYDQNFKLIKARVSPREFKLPAGGARTVNVVVPFLGATQKWFRICTERVPDRRGAQQIRTRVCGRFYAARVLPQ